MPFKNTGPSIFGQIAEFFAPLVGTFFSKSLHVFWIAVRISLIPAVYWIAGLGWRMGKYIFFLYISSNSPGALSIAHVWVQVAWYYGFINTFLPLDLMLSQLQIIYGLWLGCLSYRLFKKYFLTLST